MRRTRINTEGKEITWYECDIFTCSNKAKYQSVTTGKVICKNHYEEIALFPHRTGFVLI